MWTIQRLSQVWVNVIDGSSLEQYDKLYLTGFDFFKPPQNDSTLSAFLFGFVPIQNQT